MKQALIISLLLASLNSIAITMHLSQKDSVKGLQQMKTNILTLQKENTKLNSSITDLKTRLANAEKRIDSLQIQIQKISQSVIKADKKLDDSKKSIVPEKQKNIKGEAKSSGSTLLYVILSILSAILLAGILRFIFNKPRKKEKYTEVYYQSGINHSVNEKKANELNEQSTPIENNSLFQTNEKIDFSSSTNIEPDHSLALSVATEVNTIERNISLMDKSIKGWKQLERSVGNLKNNLSASGYEMPELLGKPYRPGMNLIVNSSIPNEHLEKGVEIITKILTPQVNFNNKMIQSAQVEVSVGV